MKKKIQRGKPLEELVKGSIDYTVQMIRDAFWKQFPGTSDHYYINEIFADHVIVSGWGESWTLKADEYYRVGLTREGETITFATRDDWEIVELTYQPQTAPQLAESQGKKRSNKIKIEERINPSNVTLLEGVDEAKGTRRIRINDLMVAGQVNGNKRLYSAEVIEAMVRDWEPHLRESRGQGRLMILTGEVEHPSDKGKRRPEFLETVVRWDTLDWNGRSLSIEGDLILTSKGKDVETLMKAGVNPGGSIRGFGESKIEKFNGQKVEVVEWATLNAADLVGDPSFANEAALQESNSNTGDEDMNLEELLKLFREQPELFAGVTEAQIKKMGDEQLKKLEDSVRAMLGIGVGENIAEALKTMKSKAQQFDESQKKAGISAAIDEAVKDLPFGEVLNKQFTEAMKSGTYDSPEQVKQIAEAKRKEYGGLAATLKLGGMGFKAGSGMKVLGDVLENETGTPEYARPSFELLESLNRRAGKVRNDLRKGESPAEVMTAQILERFDALYKSQLMMEARAFNEAELTTDLNLPYSASRAIIEEAFPSLVAANIFDTGVTDVSPMRLFFETFSGETGYSATATNEVVTGGAEEVWYDLTYGRVTPGTVTVTSNPAGTTYVENVDYVINYAEGKIKFLSGGSINANDVLVTYTYTAIRKGEMAPIERGKITLSYIDIAAKADRLADQISREAIVFSRSQLGMDAVTRTLASLIRQTQRKIDQGMLYMARTAVMAVANNSAGAWAEGTTQEDYAELVRLIGAAKVKVGNRYYNPSFILCSLERAEDLSNWDGFKRDGFPNAILNAAGYAGNIKGLPIFASTEFPSTDLVVGSRELVMYRVFQPMQVKGPFPTYDVSGGTSKLIAADQYYTEEFNATVSPVQTKGAYLTVTEGS